MKFTVEIEDFYLDEQDIESGLREFVIDNVVQQIHKSIESKVNDAITVEVKKQIEKSLYRDIQEIVVKTVSDCKIPNRNDRNKPSMTIEEYVKLAKKFGDELKRRYDLLFASQIVAKLNENGLLKDETVKMLLETIEKK